MLNKSLFCLETGDTQCKINTFGLSFQSIIFAALKIQTTRSYNIDNRACQAQCESFPPNKIITGKTKKKRGTVNN